MRTGFRPSAGAFRQGESASVGDSPVARSHRHRSIEPVPAAVSGTTCDSGRAAGRFGLGVRLNGPSVRSEPPAEVGAQRHDAGRDATRALTRSPASEAAAGGVPVQVGDADMCDRGGDDGVHRCAIAVEMMGSIGVASFQQQAGCLSAAASVVSVVSVWLVLQQAPSPATSDRARSVLPSRSGRASPVTV